VVVTGVSGSGKSTLVHKTLYNGLLEVFGTENHKKYSGRTSSARGEELKPGAYSSLHGAENITGVVLLDQRPIGKSSRSNPATYLKAWDEVRRIYANQVHAIRKGFTPQMFSFNVD